MSQMISKRREDYQAPSFFIDTIELTISLHPSNTLVKSVMSVRKNSTSIKGIATSTDMLELNGEQLSLKSIIIDGKPFSAYSLTADTLSLDTSQLADTFVLQIENEISPKENASLEGLYLSDGAYCTQCEAEGFRKITYFLDRPDILSIFTCHIICSDPSIEFLLSNGNKVGDTILPNGDRQVSWHDPFKKPCYLFALVAGSFDLVTDTYETMSGRKVALELFVEKGRKHQGQHALDSLKKSMQWDEDTFGLEYDLNVYMVVAVDFFNMGAMENKGLNVFNSKYVLADAHSATDKDYFNVEAIIAHEYFHNWTGNRVTCRDWFQLSLKEGLTVFRDQCFSADMFNPLSTRIDQVNVIKEHQFAEDSGPMSHPIRPDEVIEMNNFYTVTVYDKGAEVIRMLHTLLSKDGFRKGMDLYFQRHDGQAVTCDDFVSAMQDANNIDLSHFKRWYSQSGTPVVSVSFDQFTNNTLVFSQHTPETADQTQDQKEALYIPIKIDCLTPNGDSIGLSTDIFILDKESERLELKSTEENLIPVLLADFSAPVKIEYDYQIDELIVILGYAKSDYSKWDASQKLYVELIKGVYKDSEYQIDESVYLGLDKAIHELRDKPAVLAEILSLPSTESLLLEFENVDPIKLEDARLTFAYDLATHVFSSLHEIYQSIPSVTYQYEKQQVNLRKLKNSALLLASYTQNATVFEMINQQYKTADNMTDKLGAIKAAQVHQIDLFDMLMTKFESEYGEDAVVMDKWFALHANTYRDDILSQLALLSSHQQYSIKNPNKVRSLVGSFAFYNTRGFHAVDGSGYKYVTDYLMELDALNPQVASRIVTSLIQWKKYDLDRQNLLKTQLARLLNHKGLSKDLFEKVSKSLVNS